MPDGAMPPDACLLKGKGGPKAQWKRMSKKSIKKMVVKDLDEYLPTGWVIYNDKMRQIEVAIVLATEAHAGQTDKVNEPYILHPIRVMLAVSSERAKIVAMLHDVIEDSHYTAEDLRKQFDDEIVDAVVAISKVKGESYEEYLHRVKANSLAREVKIADVRDNASPIRLYKLEPETVKRLTTKYMKALKFLEGWA
jgi:(p)ppGpp synthase/HD superfamily hydrolase